MAARKGQFKKGGGRVGGGHAHHKVSKSRGGGGVVVVERVAAPAKRKASHAARRTPVHTVRKGKRKYHGDGGLSLGKVVLTGLVLGSAAETNSGPLGSTLYDVVQKIPGAKTFGGAVTAGVALGAVHHFTRFGGQFRPWMKAAGMIGIGLAALKLGVQGTGFKWLGDVIEDQSMDVT